MPTYYLVAQGASCWPQGKADRSLPQSTAQHPNGTAYGHGALGQNLVVLCKLVPLVEILTM